MNKYSSGFALIPAILFTSLLITMGCFFLTSTLSEKRISDSYSISQQTYYMAESGIEYVIWKLKNDPAWENNFETDSNWTQSYSGGSELFANGSFDILIQNYDLAKADVTAASAMSFGNKQSKRVIKTKIFKALGESAIDNNAILADQDIDVAAADIDIDNGSIFANDDIVATLASVVDAQDKAQAADDIFILGFSTINAAEMHSANVNPPAPEYLDIPAVDFDSFDPDSFKSQAQLLGQYYSKAEFNVLLDSGPVTFDGAVYVSGNIIIEDNHDLTVNGVLATSGKITVGRDKKWWQVCPDYSATLNINHIDEYPAGMFSKSNIEFLRCVNDISVNGVIYAGNELSLTNLSSDFTLNGGIIARSVDFALLYNGVDISYDDSVIIDTLGGSDFSPVITVEYWEEQY
ncbi:MAG: pilus assembly PilX N-terminal domain-containing protein [bacterium]